MYDNPPEEWGTGYYYLSRSWLHILKRVAHKYDIDFIVTPFSRDRAAELVGFVDYWKISSFEALAPWVEECKEWMQPLIISLGQCDNDAVTRICQTFPRSHLMACTNKYPTPLSQAGLGRVSAAVGLSSHTAGWADCIAAAALQAPLIEKHIRVEGQKSAPDYGPHSLWPCQFKAMVADIRGVEAAYWDGPVITAPEGRRVWK